MGDLMLLVHAAELERSSLSRGMPTGSDDSTMTTPTTTSSSSPHEKRIDCRVLHHPMRPPSHGQQQQQQQSLLLKDNITKPRRGTTSTAASTVAKGKSKTRIPMNPLVSNWTEHSLGLIHDLVNQLVPPASNDSSTKFSKLSVPTTTITPTGTTTVPLLIRREETTNRFEKGDLKWKAMFDCLVKYKEEFGNCEVPARWEPNKTLAYWVVRQRMLYRRQSLSSEKVQLLEDVGFTWAFSLERYQRELATNQALLNVARTPQNKGGATTTTSSNKLSSSSSRSGEQFLSSKQIRQLEQLGLRWDCFATKRVRFQLDESEKPAPERTINSTNSIRRRRMAPAVAVAPGCKRFRKCLLASSSSSTSSTTATPTTLQPHHHPTLLHSSLATCPQFHLFVQQALQSN